MTDIRKGAKRPAPHCTNPAPHSSAPAQTPVPQAAAHTHMQPCHDECVTIPISARNSQRCAQRNHAESTLSRSYLAAPSQALQPSHEATR
eukprot:12693509-Alexandrium_andersonii.AAC.1